MVDVWTPGILAAQLGQRSDNQDWKEQVAHLVTRAHERGDGVAIYANVDLGSPEVGEWQVCTYGSEHAQLETRGTSYFASTADKLDLFTHDSDFIPKRLPDIGGRINWRYYLHAIVPPTEPKAFNDPTTRCCGRDAADCDCPVTVS